MKELVFTLLIGLSFIPAVAAEKEKDTLCSEYLLYVANEDLLEEYDDLEEHGIATRDILRKQFKYGTVDEVQELADRSQELIKFVRIMREARAKFGTEKSSERKIWCPEGKKGRFIRITFKPPVEKQDVEDHYLETSFVTTIVSGEQEIEKYFERKWQKYQQTFECGHTRSQHNVFINEIQERNFNNIEEFDCVKKMYMGEDS